MIFAWYTNDDSKERMGSNKIANELNRMGYPTYDGGKWKGSSVLNIIKNAVYAGRIQWKKKVQQVVRPNETAGSQDPASR